MTNQTSYLLTPLDAQNGMFVNNIPIMRAISHEIESIVLDNHLSVDLYAGFQRFSFFAVQAERYRQLAQVCRTVYVWGIPDIVPPDIPNITYVSLSEDMEIAREWFLVVDSPTFFTALIAEEKTYHFNIPKEERLFEGIWTYNPQRVGEAAALLAQSLDLPYAAVQEYNYEAQSYHLAAIFAHMMHQREQRVVDKALIQHRQALFESGLASSETPLLLLDERKTVIAASKTACAILGEEMSSLVGKPLRVCGNGIFAQRDPTRVASDMMALLSISGDDLLAATCKPIANSRAYTIGWVVHLHYVNHYHTRIPRPQLPIRSGLQPYATDIQRQLAGLVLLDSLSDAHRQTIRQTQHLLNDMVRQIERIALLDELEAQGEVKKRETEVTALLRPIIHDQRSTANEQGISLSLNVPDGLSLVWCQPDQVRRALRELLDNVVQHASASDTASIQVHEEQGYITIMVSDTGPGVTPDLQERLADSFYRATYLNTRTGRIGLGFALVRAIASAHHGYFRVESTPGQGTVCMLMLPVRQ